MHKPTRITLVGIALSAALLAAGCSGGQPAKEDGPKTVSFMTWESAETNAQLDKVIAETWKSDDVVIKRLDAPSGDYSNKLGSLAQAKNLPDIFWCGNDTEQQYSQLGLLVDWTPKLGGDLTADDFGGLGLWTTDKGVGGLPSLRNVFGVWYNADLFEAAGVPLPKQGWTWDDMYAAAAALKGAGGSTFGLTADMFVTTDGPFAMGQYSVSAGGKPFTDNVNAPTVVEADKYFTEGVEKLAGAIANGSVAPPEYDVSNMASLFAAGKQPMMIGGQWQAQSFLSEAKGFTWGWAPLPHQGTPTTLYDAIGMCTPTTTADQDATFEALKFLNTKVIPQVMADSYVAPPAYLPGQKGYLDALDKVGAPSVAETVHYSLDAKEKVGLRFTTNWASQVNDQTLAIYLPILKGNKPVSELQSYVDAVRKIMESNS